MSSSMHVFHFFIRRLVMRRLGPNFFKIFGHFGAQTFLRLSMKFGREAVKMILWSWKQFVWFLTLCMHYNIIKIECKIHPINLVIYLVSTRPVLYVYLINNWSIRIFRTQNIFSIVEILNLHLGTFLW